MASRPPVLSEAELAQYRRDGFIVLERYFDVERELKPVMEGIEVKVERLAQKLLRAGKIQNPHSDAGLYRRLALLERDFPGAATLIHMEGDLDGATQRLWAGDRLLELAQQILGPDVAGHPVWNLRSKTPSTALATVPWHQDVAYLSPGAERTEQLTAWVPLLDVTRSHGPMTLVRGGHSGVGVLPHHLERQRKNKTTHSGEEGHPRSWYVYIEDKDLPAGEVVVCEMKLGDVLLLGNMIPHCTTENVSDEVRWSLDLRWQRPGDFSGFEDIKPLVLMREGGKPPASGIDWCSFNSINRTEVQQRHAGGRKEDDFTMDVRGPWMDRWAAAS